MTAGPQPAPAERVGAVIVAAGRSARMGGIDKTFAPLLGKPLLLHTLSHFQHFLPIAEIVLVLAPQSLELGKELVAAHQVSKVSRVCAGGETRQDSVRRGLEALDICQWVMVHDGARPCLDGPLLERGLAAARQTGAAVAGVPVKDTIKVVTPQGLVADTPTRESLWAAQTPQVFRYDLLLEAHQRGSAQAATDDAALVEALGHPVHLFPGSYRNIKVTTPEDLALVEVFLGQGAED
jgi:2-C-methyl-D-erythritol 4-phosphate cytidylyltransferase